MTINIQLDGCSTGASYCGPVELVAADRGPVCGCLLMFVTHHTLSRGCHEVAPPHAVTLQGRVLQLLHPLSVITSPSQPLSCYRDNLDTRTLPPAASQSSVQEWRMADKEKFWLCKALHSLLLLLTPAWCPSYSLSKGVNQRMFKREEQRTAEEDSKTFKYLKKSVQKHEKSIKH